MIYFNMTAVADNSTSLLGLMQSVNTNLAEGYLGIVILIIVFTTLLLNMTYTTNDIRRALIASSTISFAVALMLRAGDLIPDVVLYIALITMAISAAVGWVTSY